LTHSNKNRVRGFSHERDLARRFFRLGFAVMRAPASGSKAKRLIYPDLIAIKDGNIFAFEIKTTSKPRYIYIPKHQIDKLVEFCKRANALPLIAVKIIGKVGWRFIKLEYLDITKSGNYKIIPSVIYNGMTFNDILSLASKIKQSK